MSGTGERVRRLRAGLRSAAAAMALFAAATVAQADTREEANAQATGIETLLDANRPADAENIARAAVERAERSLGAEAAETANLYRLLGDALFNQKRFREAEPFFRKALIGREAALGPDNLDIARSAGDLAVTLKELKHYGEAESFYQQALAIRQKALGPHHPDTARSLYRLGRLYDTAGNFEKAARTIGEAIEAGRKAFGPDDRQVILWISERSAMLHDAGDLAAAEASYRDILPKAESILEEEDLASLYQGLANLLTQTLRPDEAVGLYRKALAIREKVLGADHPKVAATLLPLGRTLMALDRPAEAEPIFVQLLGLHERTAKPDGAAIAEAARYLAQAARRQEHGARTEIYLKQALTASTRAYGPDDALTGLDMLALGTHLAGQQRFREAEPLLSRAIVVIDAADPRGTSGIVARVAFSFLKSATGAQQEAITLMRRALADQMAATGSSSTAVADIMVSLAFMELRHGNPEEAGRLAGAAEAIYAAMAPHSRALIRMSTLMGDVALAQGRATDAQRIFAAALARIEARYRTASIEARSPVGRLGTAEFALGNYAEAARLFEHAIALTEQMAAIDIDVAFANRTGEAEDEAAAHGAIYDYLVKSNHRLAVAQPAQREILADKAFMAAQRVNETQAAAALGLMAQRQAAGTGALAKLVRERQDLVGRWRADDRRLTELMSAANDTAALTALRARLDGSDAHIRRIDARLRVDFPEFANLQKPSLASIAQVQERLGEDEVLLFFSDTTRLVGAGFETYLWAIPKRGAVAWIRLQPDTGELSAAVRHLRASMGVGTETRGAQSFSDSPSSDWRTDVIAEASKLYDWTLRPVEDLIAGKKLLIVPSRKLSQLPFHLMVSERPPADAADPYREARWLLRDHAIAVLPAVSALRVPGAGRQLDDGRTPYLGFANPLLTGSGEDDRRAFARQICPEPAAGGVARTANMPAGGIADISSFFRGATADVAAVRRLAPLPETTDEACAIARTLGADADALRLGAAAVETEIKRMSAAGTLARVRLLHFATHGLVSGDLAGLAEPAIVLTPPDEASAENDGLLTASEVTTLKLDADWVVLSACNTASGDGGGEALSGLAKAFFYAGTRSLLVSHWPVNSDAAVSLVTGTVNAIAGDPSIDRAEALRRAMLAEIDKGGPHADPANWAPFVLVGMPR
jgi:CHAT domain-containing protein/tetratricopeptide (TPR) repeat protein